MPDKYVWDTKPEEMLECARREAFMRRRVYPGRIASGRMKESDAEREIRIMDAIVEFLSLMIEPDLFKEPPPVPRGTAGAPCDARR